MKPSASEAVNFFWYCRVAAMLIDELPDTTVTKAMALRSVRMATLCAAGRNGILYASVGAREEANGRPLHSCGLVREHAIPVNLVRTLVLDELRATRGMPLPSELDGDTQGLPPEVLALFQDQPRAWQVARIIRKWTSIAWVTEDEHTKLEKSGLGDSMPAGWTYDMDPFQRYEKCGIKVTPLERVWALAATPAA